MIYEPQELFYNYVTSVYFIERLYVVIFVHKKSVEPEKQTKNHDNFGDSVLNIFTTQSSSAPRT